MNPDFEDFLRALLDADARFMVVGAHALAVHGIPRATGDIDIWIEASAKNAERVWSALTAFGAPMESIGIKREDRIPADPFHWPRGTGSEQTRDGPSQGSGRSRSSG